ncbi:MAG: hypothetical protein H0V82_00310 [Candidatus Protochlamydia sp.]|nr:hypothetical protein [Candidatus Protochlamydia sp.]
MNSISLSNLEKNGCFSSYFDTTLSGIDQNGKAINVVHVSVNEENGKQVPSIMDNYPEGKIYQLRECNAYMCLDFRTLLDRNLVLLYNDHKMEMLAFAGFEKYGKISRKSQFNGMKINDNFSLMHDFKWRDTKIPITSFKMMDKKTSDCVKKTLLEVAGWFDKVPNETSKSKYEAIPKNISSYQIQQTVQPILSQTTSVPSRTKALPTPPPKSATNNGIISKGTTNTFISLADFNGNNYEKDCDTPIAKLLITAIELSKEEGFTKFEISNSFKQNIDVYPEAYLSPTLKTTCHKLKIDFFINASNNYGKSCHLILQREFFVSSSDKNIVIQKVADAANNVIKSVSII